MKAITACLLLGVSLAYEMQRGEPDWHALNIRATDVDVNESGKVLVCDYRGVLHEYHQAADEFEKVDGAPDCKEVAVGADGAAFVVDK